MKKLLTAGIFTALITFCAAASSLPKKWGYQLQNYTPESVATIKSSTNTLWIIDYSKDGSEIGKWTPAEIAVFKQNGNVIVAYLSLGEAENFRYYYPSFDKTLLTNPSTGNGGIDGEWEGNFEVKYWMPNWQAIFLKDSLTQESYVKRIVGQGFDGVFLDRVDVYEPYEEKGEDVFKVKTKQMVDFVKNIAALGKSLNPNFKTFVQNATSFTWSLENPSSFYDYVDGQIIESLYHIGENRNDNPFNPDKWVREEVENIVSNFNLPVYSVEYISGRPQDHAKYVKEAKKDGVFPLVAERELAGQLLFVK
ncbi:MAG: hypothetical protein HOE90_15970 [Bacteriovoracaceae bacterium]|jgi:cysteinyl-tRNA synthetase, unknown class|nr:hypothetical protein [Bacteriovoracaceae bacterium]